MITVKASSVLGDFYLNGVVMGGFKTARNLCQFMRQIGIGMFLFTLLLAFCAFLFLCAFGMPIFVGISALQYGPSVAVAIFNDHFAGHGTWFSILMAFGCALWGFWMLVIVWRSFDAGWNWFSKRRRALRSQGLVQAREPSLVGQWLSDLHHHVCRPLQLDTDS